MNKTCRNTSRLLLLLFTSSLVWAQPEQPELKTIPKYGPNASRLYSSHDYFRKHAAPDFWALIPYYLPQQTGSACSIASATMVLNAIRAPESLTSSMELFTQDTVLDRSRNSVWSKSVGKKGGGVTLAQLEAHLKDALTKLKLPGWQVEAIHADGTPAFAKRVQGILRENEKSDRSFLITNYLQGELTGDPEGSIGHVAPIAAYDAKADKILILDPDRQYYEPYWSPVAALIRAMNTVDQVSGKTRGLLWIHFNPSLPAK